MSFLNPFPNPYPAPTPQLTYSNNFSAPTPGTEYESSGAGAEDIVTGVASGYITFGCLVVNDSAITTTLGGGISQGVKHPASQSDLDGGVVGIAMKTAAMESRRDSYPPSYLPGDAINVKRRGKLWTATESGCASHDPVYVRTVANSGNGCIQLGAFSNQADSSNNINLSASANTFPIHWLTAQAVAGGPAAIEFDFLGL